MSVLFCKQKTAYEMRISDWSSDVCSSDLLRAAHEQSVRDLNFKLESQKGRTSALDRKIDQLTKQLNAGQGGGGREEPADRKSVVSGKSVSVRVDLGGRSSIKKKTTSTTLQVHRNESPKEKQRQTKE